MQSIQEEVDAATSAEVLHVRMALKSSALATVDQERSLASPVVMMALPAVLQVRSLALPAVHLIRVRSSAPLLIVARSIRLLLARPQASMQLATW